MRLRDRLFAVLAVSCFSQNALAAEPTPPVFEGWRPRASGELNGDTLTVRALWRPVLGDSSESTFVAYRIDDHRGRSWAEGSIPDVGTIESGCDEFAFKAVPWRSGLVIEVKAYSCWPSYPNAYDSGRFLFLVHPDSIAQSDWVDIAWDPSTGDLGSTWVHRDCIVVRTPVAAVVEGTRLDFRVVAPEGVAPREFFPVEAYSECIRWESAGTDLVTIPVYESLDATVPESLRIHPQEISVDGALVRLIPAGEELEPEVMRIGIQVNGERLFISPGVLESIGFVTP